MTGSMKKKPAAASSLPTLKAVLDVCRSSQQAVPRHGDRKGKISIFFQSHSILVWPPTAHTHTHTHTRCTLPLHSRDCVCLLDATALKLPFSLYTTTALLLLSRLSLSLSLPDLPARTSHRAVASNSPCSQTRLAGRKRTCECERCGTEQPPRSATDSTPSTAPPFATRLIGFRVA